MKITRDKWLHNGTPDWRDFLFTVAGGAVIALLAWICS